MGLVAGAEHTDGSSSHGNALNGSALDSQRSMGNGIAEDGLDGHRHSAGSSTPNGDSASHMYLDLRPFMDQAPTIVRCALSACLTALHAQQKREVTLLQALALCTCPLKRDS